MRQIAASARASPRPGESPGGAFRLALRQLLADRHPAADPLIINFQAVQIEQEGLEELERLAERTRAAAQALAYLPLFSGEPEASMAQQVAHKELVALRQALRTSAVAAECFIGWRPPPHVIDLPAAALALRELARELVRYGNLLGVVLGELRAAVGPADGPGRRRDLPRAQLIKEARRRGLTPVAVAQLLHEHQEHLPGLRWMSRAVIYARLSAAWRR